MREEVVERCLRSDRMRQLGNVPRCSSIAPFERRRDGHRLRLVHPAPLDLTAPVDEFVVAQAIGSMLDGLAWLHLHGVVHGAVGASALVDGPTGGRLSLAGACSRVGEATVADDVYAASALAYTLLFAEPPGPDAHRDARLETCASPAVAEAIRAGLDPIAGQRPSALSLAALVRGEQWLSLWDPVPPRESAIGRLQAAVTKAVRGFDGQWARAVGAVAATLLLVGGLATAHQHGGANLATVTPLGELLPSSPTTVRAETPPPVTTAATTTTTAAPTTTVHAEPAVSVLSNTAPANDPTPAPAPPSTRAVAPPPPPTAPPTTSPVPPPPTTRAPVTTRAATTTTTAPPKGKAPKDNKGKRNAADSVGALIESVLNAMFG